MEEFRKLDDKEKSHEFDIEIQAMSVRTTSLLRKTDGKTGIFSLIRADPGPAEKLNLTFPVWVRTTDKWKGY